MAVKKNADRKPNPKISTFFFSCAFQCYTVYYVAIYIINRTISRSERFNVYRNRTISRMIVGMLYIGEYLNIYRNHVLITVPM